MSAKPFIDPELINRLAESPTKKCSVIITCDSRGRITADAKPPVVAAKQLAALPGMYTAIIDSRTLGELSKSSSVTSVELDREEHILT